MVQCLSGPVSCLSQLQTGPVATHPCLGHSKWSRIHSKEEYTFLPVAIGMHIAVMRLSCIAKGVVDVCDGRSKLEERELSAHLLLQLYEPLTDGDWGLLPGVGVGSRGGAGAEEGSWLGRGRDFKPFGGRASIVCRPRVGARH